MTIEEIRVKLHDYIKLADEEKVRAIYTLVESDIPTEPWWQDKEFLADLDKKYKRYEEGSTGYTLDQVKAFVEERKIGVNRVEVTEDL